MALKVRYVLSNGCCLPSPACQVIIAFLVTKDNKVHYQLFNSLAVLVKTMFYYQVCNRGNKNSFSLFHNYLNGIHCRNPLYKQIFTRSKQIFIEVYK